MENFRVEKYLQRPQVTKIKMYNTSLETYQRQFDSQVFNFKGQDHVEVPLELVGFVYDQMKDSGIFPIFPEMTQEEIRAAHKESLLRYLKGRLNEGIRSYQWKIDDAKRAQIHLDPEPRHLRLKRWKEQLLKALTKNGAVLEEADKLEFSEDILEKSVGSDIFDAQKILQGNFETQDQREVRAHKSAEKRKKASFENVDFGDIV